MRDKRCRYPPRRPYPQSRPPLALAGAVLLAAGLVLLFLCVPGWAWAALLGCVLAAVGAVLIRLSGR